MRERRLFLPLVLLSLVFVFGLGAPSWAQAPASTAGQPAAADSSSPAPAEDAEPQEAEVAPDSPRASLETYLLQSRAGEWEKAARYLALPEERASEGPVLAERLKAVLDKHLWFDLEQISPESGGDRDDDLTQQHMQDHLNRLKAYAEGLPMP